MSKNRSTVARRVLNVVRLALLWAKKGSALRSLSHNNTRSSIPYKYEREFSFEETPIFDFKMLTPGSKRFHMLRLSCLKPKAEFDFDDYYYKESEEDYKKNGRLDDEMGQVGDDEGIDKAEEFIAKFYEQMKMQRLQYNQTSINKN